MNALFISDLHLQDSHPGLTAGFLHFLTTQANTCQHLYILGDFFEFWVGDDVATHTSECVADALMQRSKAGLQTYFMAGNRDFLLAERYANKAGMALLEPPFALELCGKRALLVHGDELCTDDVKYQQFRAMVRNPDWQRAFLGMPVEQRLQMAGQARSESKQATATNNEYIMDVNPDAVTTLMRSYDADLLIHGHTHRPARHAMTIDDRQAERIVLGDWASTGWVLEVSDSALNLREFPLGS